ncbi:MAG: pyridoxal phosphate-dependent aminotransferase [Lachnospiraceae bacterium]|nr:pyridoxal phosphate-dependent aminotransferase [Lachnospiraceae bacterium]
MVDKFQISEKVKQIPEALSIYFNQLVYSEKRRGIDIITLSLGEAFFDIPQLPFESVDFVKGYHYSDSLGLPELREKILDYYNTGYDCHIGSIKNIMISSGSKIIIYIAMATVLNEGDEVLIHEPAWLSYQEQVRLAGGVPVFIPYECDLRECEKYITAKTRMIVLNNPNNPAGFVYPDDTLREIYARCREKGIYILMDEAYSDFVLDRKEFVSVANIAEDLTGVMVVNSLSKNLGMSGWRIGYIIAEETLIGQMLKLNQHLVTCAPTILQQYLAYYFDDICRITAPQIEETVRKRNRIIGYMDTIGLEYLPGKATFYIFVKVDGIQASTLDFCLYLLFKYGIATVPGGAYGRSTDRFIRVGIGAESEERICYALDTIKMVIKEQLTDSAYVRKKLEKNGFYYFDE